MKHYCSYLILLVIPSDVWAQTVTYQTQWNTVFSLSDAGGQYVSVSDFNGDGVLDLLLGGNKNTPDKTPIFLVINNGDGTFRDATSDYIEGTLKAAFPLGTTGDFSGDGRIDVAIFDAGHAELGQAPTGGFYGEEPHLLLNQSNGKWTVSSALADAALAASLYNTAKLHAKAAIAGDIDNDGDLDIFVESGGGFENLAPHFMINNGDGTFTADFSDARRHDRLIWGQTGFWRYATHRLKDMDGDGYVDLVMGQLRRINNQQDELASKVVYNDKTGRFKEENVINLPYPNWNDGWTYVKTIQITDLNGDGSPDLILGHERGNNDALKNGNTGLYLQFLINTGKSFTDQTVIFMENQAQTTVETAYFGNNTSMPKKILLRDMNQDGFTDLVMAQSSAPMGPHAPFMYLNDGANKFSPFDSEKITEGATYFGEDAYPIDLNGDGLLDIVTVDLRPGSDNQYSTGDEYSDVIAIIASSGAPADFNSDGTVGFADFLLFVQAFGLKNGASDYDPKFDLDKSKDIGFGDFLLFAKAFGS